MSSSIDRRHHYPAMEPLKTGHANVLDRSHGFSRRRLNPLSGSIPTEFHPVDSVMSDFGNRRRGLRVAERRALKKFHMPETTPDGLRTISPAGFRAPRFGPYLRHSTVVEPPSARVHHMPGGRLAISVPCSPNTLHMLISINLPPGYTPISPCCESDSRQRQLAAIQRSNLKLREQGPQRFGCLEDASVFVTPLLLREHNANFASLSEGTNSPSTMSPSPPLQSPTLPSPASSVSSRRLLLRASIHSGSEQSLKVKREFDLDKLRGTILDPLPSRRSPNFNPEALLSKLTPLNKQRQANSASVNANHKDGIEVIDCDKEDATENTSSPQPSNSRQLPAQLIAVPINLEYARAHLPALAAVMMLKEAKGGATIRLVLPQPQAWPETVAYVYTGEAQLLTEHTKENILALGGKVEKEVDV